MVRREVRVVTLATAFTLLAAESGASAQRMAPPEAPAWDAPSSLRLDMRPPDTLPDVTIRGRAPTADSIDVMTDRLSRFTNSSCFRSDVYTTDSTERFNRAYYAELTGQADYYDTIKAGARPKTLFHAYHPILHSNVFAHLDEVPPVPGQASILGGGGGFTARTAGCLAPGVRQAADKNTSFGRALALYDKGEYDKALPLFKQAREELGAIGLGAEAALMIGKIYLAGEGVERDPVQAAYWLGKTMAARKPVPSMGRGVRAARYDPKDPGRFYHPAAEAAVLLAGIHALGDGVPRSPVQARQWFETAAAESHVPAVKVLGDLYRDGYGGAADAKKALVYYEAAAGMRHARAKYEAGGMYARGEGVKVDPKKALQLYREAAVLGDALAAYTLAVAYDLGQGVTADPKLALGFYKDAALAGDIHAQTAMGTYFYEGGVVEQNLSTARAWFGEAATSGDPDAMVNLAAMLIKGEGGEANPVSAWAWLTLARQGGRDDVAPGIASLEKRMNSGQLAQARALVSPNESAPGAAGG